MSEATKQPEVATAMRIGCCVEWTWITGKGVERQRYGYVVSFDERVACVTVDEEICGEYTSQLRFVPIEAIDTIKDMEYLHKLVEGK